MDTLTITSRTDPFDPNDHPITSDVLRDLHVLMIQFVDRAKASHTLNAGVIAESLMQAENLVHTAFAMARTCGLDDDPSAAGQYG